MTDTLALFPLNAVLVPGALMELRVFEPRYLDMVRECGREGRGFGICLILSGQEVGAPAEAAAYGTEARIEDFDTGEDGLLHLRVRGHRRFRVVRTRVRDNALVMADVAWCAPDPVAQLQAQHVLLGDVLRHIFGQIHGLGLPVPEQHLDDAAWVGWRLAELLPLSLPQRQCLLQEDDPDVRLETLLQQLADD